MRVYTGGKDGTLRGYRINVQYRKNEDPKLETTFKIGNSVTSIEISPDGKTLANTGTDKRERKNNTDFTYRWQKGAVLGYSSTNNERSRFCNNYTKLL